MSVSKEGYKMITANVVSQIADAGGAALAGNVVLGGLMTDTQRQRNIEMAQS